ncbi:MAG: beta-N-acetylhexosaminidase, partial [Anaerolineae bacterium]|nr:beta-N-acetylhexosaminidase [Anaerolineae bacterium]
MANQSLCIIPTPKQVHLEAGSFALDEHTWIALLPEANEEDAFAAQLLQEEIKELTGLHLNIVKLAKLPRKENFILLFGNTKAAEAYLGETWSWKEELPKKGEQAYILEITPKRVVAGGEGSLALFYASQTLRLLTRSERSRWPACQVLDWPSLPYRGLMLDISRGKVPTIETLELLIDQLSLYKINVLQLYTEHTFVFPHH